MTYDRKTGTIGVTGDRKQFEADMLAHFAHVSSQMENELKAQSKVPLISSKSLKDRLRGLSRPAKASIVFMVFWTAFVIFRTAASHELLGFDLNRWNDNDFFINWLVFPAVVTAMVFSVRWILNNGQGISKAGANPLTEFEREIVGWPAHQGKIALLLIKATLIGDKDSIDKLTEELTVEQFRKVVEVVQKMEKTSS